MKKKIIKKNKNLWAGRFSEKPSELMVKINASINFSQDNHSFSKFGVIRGLHYQSENAAQGKLVQVIEGEIFDVAVDIRRNSKTYSSWIGVELKEDLHQSLWIPSGFAHGFLTLSEFADVQYVVSNKWDKNLERCIIWNDKRINIDWPLSDKDLLLSKKDLKGQNLTDAESLQNIF